VTTPVAEPDFLPTVTGNHHNLALAGRRRERAVQFVSEGLTYQQAAHVVCLLHRGVGRTLTLYRGFGTHHGTSRSDRPSAQAVPSRHAGRAPGVGTSAAPTGGTSNNDRRQDEFTSHIDAAVTPFLSCCYPSGGT